MKTANKRCNALVSLCVEFTGSNLFSTRIGECYVVFSYGSHFPAFICKHGKWYENSDKYSVSTSKQMSQARPRDRVCEKLSTQEMKKLYELD